MSAGALSGRVAAVTGGGSGIGAACARALAQAGADIALLLHAEDEHAKAIAAEIVAAGSESTSIHLDGKPIARRRR